MTSRLEPYRVTAYNTSKQSENKIHDDTVARRFGFSGGLVPGVDVMAYMMHLPVAKWGRAFLERGLIEARFVKPVYDGEIAELTADESNGVLSIEVHSRGAALRHRHRVIAGICAGCFDGRFPGSRGGRGAQAGQRRFLRGRQMARHRAARLGGRSGHRISGRYQGNRSDLRDAKASAIPACCSG